LEILCPYLLAPIPEQTGLAFQAPAIESLLARADHVSGTESDPIEMLMRAAGCDWPAGHETPAAPVALLGDGVAVEPGAVWMHADPIHLRPDRNRLLVYAGDGIAPDRVEAEALVAAFNRHFTDEGLSLFAPVPARWYLRIDRPVSGLKTSPLHRVQGGSMAEHLPRGPEARAWMRLLNETQMLFYADPVNRRREASGRPIVSGIWIWGTGSLPALSGSRPDELIGDHPLMPGLAHLAERPHRSLEAWCGDPSPTAGRRLVFWDRHWRAWLDHDLEAWSRAMTELDTVIKRLWGLLRAGHLSTIRLDPCHEGAFMISSIQTWRFWRRRGWVQSRFLG
jgi:hypothetical protein